MKIPLPPNVQEDKRICAFCNGVGDMAINGPGRYLLIIQCVFFLHKKFYFNIDY